MGSCCSMLSSFPQTPLPQVSGLLERLVCVQRTTYCSDVCSPLTCPWRPIKCFLDGHTLSFYELDDSVRAEKTIKIDENFQLRSERVHLLEIRVRVVTGSTVEKWKLRAHTPASFVAWSTSLKRAKRPERIERDTCGVCNEAFSVLSRPLYCKSCGQAVCARCSSRSALLPHLGYSQQQRICHFCFSKPFRTTIDKRSSMETSTQ